MKTQNTKLNFTVKSVTKLNDNSLLEINGGTSLPCFIASYVISRDIKDKFFN